MTDFDRLYERVDKTSDNLDRLTVQVTGLAAAVKNHDDRLKIIEAQPGQQANAFRGNLGLVIAGGAGCVVPFLIGLGGLVAAIIGSLIGKGVL